MNNAQRREALEHAYILISGNVQPKTHEQAERCHAIMANIKALIEEFQGE
jgi:hypothetical protein